MLGNKEIMAKNIVRLMNDKGVNQQEICKALGFKQSTFSDWMNAKSYPRIDKIEMLANYFGVNKSDLVEEPTEETYYLDEDAKDLAQFMYDNPEYKVLFDATRKVKKEDIEFVKQMLDRFKKD